MPNKLPPRAIIQIDITDSLLSIMETVAEMAVEKYRSQEREDNPQPVAVLLTLDEAAAALKMTKASLKRLRDAGDIQTTHVGPSVRISSKEIEKFHQSN